MTEEVRRPRVPTAAKYHSALKAVIKRAIIVLDALGDSEMRFQKQGRSGTAQSTMLRWSMATRKRQSDSSRRR